MDEQQGEKQKEVWERLWSQPINYHWDPLSQAIYEQIVRTIGNPSGKKILEAGSGTGKISLMLALDDAAVTLVDYAPAALEQSKLAFRRKNRSARFVLADIRQMPLREKQFDLSWSAGVLEHFGTVEKVAMLKEMARVTKPGGKILVFVPHAGCLPYRIGKLAAERRGVWRYGWEEPVVSLRAVFREAGLEVETEHDIGFIPGLDFLDFIPGSEEVKRWAAIWYSQLAEEERRLFPGYLLATTATV